MCANLICKMLPNIAHPADPADPAYLAHVSFYLKITYDHETLISRFTLLIVKYVDVLLKFINSFIPSQICLGDEGCLSDEQLLSEPAWQ